MRKFLSLRECTYPGISVLNFQGLSDTRLAQIPIIEWTVRPEQLNQSRNVDIVIVVKVAPPLATTRQKGVKFDAHLAAERLTANTHSKREGEKDV